MHHITYLPLDERPCNALFPVLLSQMTDVSLHAPPLSLLGKKKSPASYEAIEQWLVEQVSKSDQLIVSIDMLVYGGIVPSRLHDLSITECERRLDLLQTLKKQNPRLQIKAFNLIMRAPAYNSSEEEPDYYEQHGQDLNTYGSLTDKREKEPLTTEEKQRLKETIASLPQEVLDDFLHRRAVNGAVNRKVIDLAETGMIDFLIIPLDDNAQFGYTAMEQRKLIFAVEEKNLWDRVYIYPGADEIGCTLFSRAFCELKSYRPEVFVRYSSTQGPFVIPKYEDRSLNESIKYHLTAAGAAIGDSSVESDVVLMVNSAAVGQERMAEPTMAYSERHRSYFSEVNYREFATAIQHYAEKGKIVALADVSQCNGADHALMKLLAKGGLLSRISAFAAWNTSGNTLGTVISHGIIESYYKKHTDTKPPASPYSASRMFYLYRLIEDWGYQSIVRQVVTQEDLPQLNASYFKLSHVQSEVEKLIADKLEAFISDYLSDLSPQEWELSSVHLPWDRMFEVGFQLTMKTDDSSAQSKF